MNRVAYCFFTNGHGSNELRGYCYAALRRFVGADVATFTLVAGDPYVSPHRWETLVDGNKVAKDVLGLTPQELAGGNPSNGNLPLGLFVKYLIPMIPAFEDFDRIVSMDDDIEVVKPSFRRIAETPLRADADVAMVQDHSCGPRLPHIICRKSSREWWMPGCRYHNGGLVVLRGRDPREEYRRRVKQMFEVHMQCKFFLNEESAANQFLAVQSLPPDISVVPFVPGVNRAGIKGEALRAASALHYAGVRKRAAIPWWRMRAAAGLPVDYAWFERSVQ